MTYRVSKIVTTKDVVVGVNPETHANEPKKQHQIQHGANYNQPSRPQSIADAVKLLLIFCFNSNYALLWVVFTNEVQVEKVLVVDVFEEKWCQMFFVSELDQSNEDIDSDYAKKGHLLHYYA